MTTQFLTVKDAARLVGKSPSSIRRIIHPILKDDSHADRVHILPSVEEAMQLRLKGVGFGWQLSEELLRREVPIEVSSEKGNRDSQRASSGNEHGELLSMLRRELDIKNQQISQQADLISKQADLVSGLSERLREGNVLMATLQQRLALPDGRDSVPATVVASATSNAKPEKIPKVDRPEKGTAKSDKTPRHFFGRLFR